MMPRLILLGQEPEGVFLGSEWWSLLGPAFRACSVIGVRPRGSQAHSTSVEATCLRRGNGSVSTPPTSPPSTFPEKWGLGLGVPKDPAVPLQPGKPYYWFRLEIFALLFLESLFQVHAGGAIQTWV